jgi:hypothetical protein
MRLFPRSLAAAILTAGCYLSIATVNVLAQSPQPGPSTSAPDLSDQKLSATAEKERIVAEANNELTKAVTEQGLSVEEYTSILDAARDNPEIRDKLIQHIRPSDQ